MLKKLKRNLVILAAVIMPAFTLAMPATVGAQIPDTANDQPNIQGSLEQGTCLSTDQSACPDQEPGSGVNDFIADVVNIFSLVVGVVAVIMIIIGGFKYITSGGNDANVSSAKNTILYAIIGLVIVALAQFIVRFVLDKVTST